MHEATLLIGPVADITKLHTGFLVLEFSGTGLVSIRGYDAGTAAWISMFDAANITFEPDPLLELEATTVHDALAEITTRADSGVDTANAPAANEFARFTDTDTIEGRTVAETKTDLSLNNVDNTSDATKHANTALTGIPTAPTAAPGTNTVQISTTAFVQAAIAALIASAPGALDTLDELAAAFGDDPSFAATMTTALAGKQPTLVSGTNIKTINGSTVLGAGDLVVSSATNIKETEVDFGSAVNQIDKSFTITDADVAPTSQILANIAYKSPSGGRHIDEIAAEEFDILCAPGTGDFNMLLRSRSGSVSGKFLVNYLVG